MIATKSLDSESESDIDSYEESEEYSEICIHCGKTTYEDYIEFLCKKCTKVYCYDCIYSNDACTNVNCHFCRYIYCFDDIDDKYHCEDCITDELLDKIQNEEPKHEKYIKNMKIRKTKLIEAFQDNGLELRDDSELCQKYIQYGCVRLDYVIKRMSEMKYLFNYCHMRKILNKTKSKYRDEYYEYEEIFDEAENKALEHYSDGEYPDIWPWISEKLERNARIIQKHCYNWIWKPVTRDGKLGIDARIRLRKCDLGDYLYADEIDGL